jgi:hypothetical protein
LTNTVTFTAGDNNIFNLLTTGGFTRTTTCVIDLGLRAPVVISATPSTGDCSVCQDLTISGACFILPNGTLNVTTVFAIDAATGATVPSQRFAVINANFIDALFCFGSANAGHTFLIFVSGPSGQSQNLTTLPAGTKCPAGSLGNQQGIQVTFKCNAPLITTQPCAPPAVTGCNLTRAASGKFILTATVSNILSANATITVGGGTPRNITFIPDLTTFPTTGTFRMKGGVCALLPGAIVVTNPAGSCPANPSQGATSSAPFQCNQACPTQ